MVNSTHANTKERTDFAKGCITSGVEASDLSNLIRCEFSAPYIAPLPNHIAHVVFLRPEKKMLRVDARRVVAAVKNAQPFRDWAIVEFPRYNVGAAIALTYFHAAVTVHKSGRPKPAASGFHYLRPKPRLVKALLCNLSTRGCAISPARCVANPDAKYRPALLTNASCRSASTYESVSAQLRAKARLAFVDLVGLCEKWTLTVFASAWYCFLSHDLNLRRRLGLWSGSFGWSNTRSGRLYFNTTDERTGRRMNRMGHETLSN